MKINYNSRTLQWTILALLALTWGSSFILMKRGLFDVNGNKVFLPTEVATIRILSAFLLLLPFAIRGLSKIPLNKWKYLLVVGFIGNAIPAFLFAKAQTHVVSSVAGILNASSTIFTLLISILFYRDKAVPLKIIGVIIGFVGVIGILYYSANQSLNINFQYGIFIIIACVFYAINTNVLKHNLEDVDSIDIASVSFFLISIPVLIYAIFFTNLFNGISIHDPVKMKGLFYLFILGIFGSGIAVITLYKLIKFANILFVSSVTYLIPVVAIMWGVIDGEKFKLIYLLWIFLIFAGIFLVNKRANKK